MGCPIPASNDNCDRNCRCNYGDCAGQAFDCANPCPPGQLLVEEECDCKALYFVEVPYRALTMEILRNPAHDCEDGITDHENPLLQSTYPVDGIVGQDPQGAKWLIYPGSAPCVPTGTGACSTAGFANLTGQIQYGDGSLSPLIDLNSVSCFGFGNFNPQVRQTVYAVDVVTGYGYTLGEAQCDAKRQAPRLDDYAECLADE